MYAFKYMNREKIQYVIFIPSVIIRKLILFILTYFCYNKIMLSQTAMSARLEGAK